MCVTEKHKQKTYHVIHNWLHHCPKALLSNFWYMQSGILALRWHIYVFVFMAHQNLPCRNDTFHLNLIFCLEKSCPETKICFTSSLSLLTEYGHIVRYWECTTSMCVITYLQRDWSSWISIGLFSAISQNAWLHDFSDRF